MVFSIGLIVISLGALVAGRGYTQTARRMRAFACTQEAYLQTHTPAIGRWFIIGGSVGIVLGLLILIGSL